MLYDVQVKLAERSYPIHIGDGLLDEVGQYAAASGLSGRCLLITDQHTQALFAERVTRSLKAVGVQVNIAVVPAGESSKSVEQLSNLLSACVKAGLDRNSFIVALGGGVIGDLAGFTAAAFLRGIAFMQVPTSLLAMVDSSVGGKTGINLPEGKNLVGAFHQPSLVLADIGALDSLPARELRAGLAEVVKYGIIRDRAFFEKIESVLGELNQPQDRGLWAGIVGRCCEIKAEVVSADERESGLRAILNYGHTLGHAIENIAGYGGRYIHGEAISVGMVYASILSLHQLGMDRQEVVRVGELLAGLGLPVQAPELDWPALRRAMAVDKKTVGGVPRFVLASSIGEVTIGHELTEGLLEAVWSSMG
jgi:3-dehydroquinate synthase